MESALAKLHFLDLKDASEAERALLKRILALEHDKVELPIDDQIAAQPVYETCRLPPDGTEYAADERTPSAAESPPPPQPPPPPPQQQQQRQQQQQHLPAANQAGLAGDLSASSLAGVPPLAAPPHLMPHMLPGGAMFQQQASFPYSNMFVNMPGGVMFPMPAGYPMSPAGYPVSEPAVAPETAAADRRRSGGSGGGGGGGKKGADKPLSALAPSFPMGFPMTPRTAAGQPLMMQPMAGNPYNAPYYPMSYSYYPGPPYSGADMMLAQMSPHQLQQLQQQQLDVTVPPPAMEEETRTPHYEPYGSAEAEAEAPPVTGEAEPAASAAVPSLGDAGAAPSSAAALESPESSALEAASSDTIAAAPAPAMAAPTGPVRLSFGFNLDDKLVVGGSAAVLLEQSGCTPEPREGEEEEEERAGDGRSSSAEPTEPTAPTSYVATVTVSQRRVLPPPPPPESQPQPETERIESPPAADGAELDGRGLTSPAAAVPEADVERTVTSPESEPVLSPEPPANGVCSPLPAPEPTQGQETAPQQAEAKEQETDVLPAAPAPAPAPAPAAPRSWASLFSKKTEGAAPAPAAPVAPKPVPAPPVPETDKEVLALGEALARFELCHKNVYLQPRGLTNKSNWCYINAVLQALASCTPFYHLMKSLPHNVGVLPDQSRTPIIDAMVEFVREFSPLPELPRISRRERERGQLREIQFGAPLEPGYVYAMLSRVSSDAFRVAGRQEDAEEFLTCLLNGLQDEMTEMLKVYQKNQDEARPPMNGATNGDARHHSEDGEGDSDEWQEIFKKNRAQVTRSAELQSTPISRVFSGQLRSCLHRQGTKATANVQSFFSLPLDIQSPQVTSVEQALEALVQRNPVVGLTCPQSGQPVDGYQQVALEITPPILILHLKRFLYDPETDGVQKLLKRVTFPVDLELKKELLSNVRTKMPPGQKRYRLFAVVYHSGKESTKGHYITDAYHPAYQQWVRYDDSSISAVAEPAVLRPEPPQVPYILFYRRVDTVAAHNGK